MTTSMGAQELAQQIEKVVENFIAAGWLAATEAVERAFESADRQKTRARTRPAVSRRRISRRRSPEDMVALSERLYEAVCANPGETMSVFARVVGAGARALHGPAARLKRAGRIRSVGQRQFARYFPMLREASKSG